MERAPTEMETARLKRLAWTDVALTLVMVSVDPTLSAESSITDQHARVQHDSIRTRPQIAVASVNLKVVVQTAIVQLEVHVWAASAKQYVVTDSIALRVKDACPACVNYLASPTASVQTARLVLVATVGPAVVPAPTVQSTRHV